MPIPWAAAAKAIPWGDVIAAAPGLVRNARELLGRARGQTADAEPGPPAPTVEQRLVAQERRIAVLNEELQASSALISQLAEHNARLVVAVDRLHRQLSIAQVLAGVALLGAIAALLLP